LPLSLGRHSCDIMPEAMGSNISEVLSVGNIATILKNTMRA
jgi:hypothetical protein